ncbi:heavy metal translocating P-type ATPase [Salinicoccus halodurans]|uniref:P-type Cu(+) transporter n=1 Tax=Salinicoccus halodurans TaxID=407035 RepID=A0A0F7HJ02_9STAP|nr:heavy metal translocating P-type ATPase [Salinicoccus halodurans]AKG73017.1 ATPase [Salinicoccus halodurans]SFK77514.1 Cu2+-exporting ATPase [Salinicoccus halodurans]
MTDHHEHHHGDSTHHEHDTNHHHHGDHMDHSAHEGHHHGDFKKKFFISLIFAVPIIFLSPMMGIDLPFQFTFPGSDWLVLVLATVLYFYGGQPFLTGAKDELKAHKPGMMTLVALGISVAYFYSIYAFYMNHFDSAEAHTMDFFWELATLIVIMLLGHWIEMKAVGNAGDALKKMAELLPNTAVIVGESGDTKEVELSEVNEGDTVQVKAGDNIPVDGVITSGRTTVDEALVTGESKNIEKTVDDSVIGGSVNGSGTITVEVTGTGESSYLSQVMGLVGAAQNDKSRAELLSNRIAGYLFYFALITGLIAFIVWLMISNSMDIALVRLVTVLIIACPHALGLAIPLVTARSTSIGAKNGLIVKNRESLETARKLEVVMMDKTGTLTEGNFAVNHYESFTDEYSNEEVLGFMASIEKSSNHPLAVGILNKAEEQSINIPHADDVNNIAGIGLEAVIGGQKMKITSVSYLEDNEISYDKEQFESLAGQGNSISFLIIEDKNSGIIAQGDRIKSSSRQMIKELTARGIQPVMLTGDNKQVAEAVADELGITDVHGQLMPEDKETIIKEYQNEGKTVMMVGDGINDAPSLVRADIGVAIGAGTDIAVESGDVILVKSEPSDILQFLSLSENTMKKTVQNLWWGAGYNILAVPLAAGILASAGILLSPAAGAVLMSLSTIIVALNAMTLKLN